MKIAIDARWIFNEISGIGAYTRDLIRLLARIDQSNQYLLLFSDADLVERTVQETDIAGVESIQTVLLPYGLFSIRNQLQLGSFLRRHAVDVYHSTNYMIPLPAFPRNRSGRPRCVVTIHDVIPMIYPHHAPRSRKSPPRPY